MLELVLASTSRYRRDLLQRLGVAFSACPPAVDETALPEEDAAATALRLSELKARSVVTVHPRALIVGSDQMAALGGSRLGKPGTHARAKQQLQWLSGKSATFYTAVTLLNATTGRLQSCIVPTTVEFRPLSVAQIESYLAREQPYDCAGSAKSEGLGIALIRSIDTTDPTALIGLPLIALTEMLESEGVSVL